MLLPCELMRFLLTGMHLRFGFYVEVHLQSMTDVAPIGYQRNNVAQLGIGHHRTTWMLQIVY